jgi:hypothetical protein
LSFYQLKIKPIAMQTMKIVQAVALMLVVALAASCAASKEYASRLFGPKPVAVKDSPTIAMRFLELDQLRDSSGWVSTSLVNDSSGMEDAEPEVLISKKTTDSTVRSAPVVKKAAPAETPVKDTISTSEPVAKSNPVNGVRNKKTRE